MFIIVCKKIIIRKENGLIISKKYNNVRGMQKPEKVIRIESKNTGK